MTKYYLTGLICLLLFLAAITSNRPGIGLGCHEHLYWFKVQTQTKTCFELVQNDLGPVFDDGDGILTEIDIQPQLLSDRPFGCMDVQIKACAVGYSETQIEVVYSNGFWIIRPKASQIHNFRCCSRHPDEL